MDTKENMMNELESASHVYISISNSLCDIAYDMDVEFINIIDDGSLVIRDENERIFTLKEFDNYDVEELEVDYLLSKDDTTVLLCAS